MGKILDYIQQSSNGKFQCYKTKKFSLDANNENDTIAYNYDDNTVVQTTKSVIAETEMNGGIFTVKRDLVKDDNGSISTQNLQKILIERVNQYDANSFQMIYTTSFITKELNNSPYVVGKYYTKENPSLKDIPKF